MFYYNYTIPHQCHTELICSFTDGPPKAYIKYLVTRQICAITVTVIFNMSDKMNPLWKYLILKFVQKNS